MTGLIWISLAFAAENQRHAVVVGSNEAAAGRPALRYAHSDAAGVSGALEDLGAFSEVALLLDPRPDLVLEALDEALQAAERGGPGGMVLFYYSGHADDSALYPGGRTLPLEDLKEIMDADERASVRVGIVDACRGGGWTGAKGLVPDDEPFEVTLPTTLESEGTVLIASSSGSESAHEGSAVGGSFFTHHLVAGLRGAADGDENGQISLSEVFDYAKRGTVRDAVRYAKETQTPSFDVHLRGKQDLVLTRIDQGTSTLSVSQTAGPLEVVHLDSGASVLSLERGSRDVNLALPPGDYLLRRQVLGRVFSKEISLDPGDNTRVAESQLELREKGTLGAKGHGGLRLQSTQLMIGPGRAALQFTSSMVRPLSATGTPGGLSVSAGAFGLGVGATVGITENLQASFPATAVVSPGRRGPHEAVFWGGATRLDFLEDDDTGYTAAARMVAAGDWVVHLDEQNRVSASLSAGTTSPLSTDSLDGDGTPRDPEISVNVAFSRTFGDLATVNIPVSWIGGFGNMTGPTAIEEMALFVAGGAMRAGRPLPLVQGHVSNRVTIDGNLSIGVQSAIGVQSGFFQWSRYRVGVHPFSPWLGATVSL